MKFFDRVKKFPFILIGFILILISSVLVLWLSIKDNSQASAPITLRVVFQGEYSVGGGEFKQLESGEKIPANKGDLTLKGYFELQTEDGEALGRVFEGCDIAMYFNHVGATLEIEGQEPHLFDTELANLSKDSCGETWINYTYEGTETDVVIITLHNPHAFGNVTAYNDFLDNIYVNSNADSFFEKRMSSQGTFERSIGFALIIVGFVLLGVALYATLLRLKQGATIMHYGLITIFAGIYFIFSSKNVFLWNGVVAFNTSVLLLSSMLYAVFLSSLAVRLLNGRLKTIGRCALGVLALCAVVIMCVSAFSNVLLYDTRLIWGIIQSVVSLVLVVLMGISIKGKNMNNLFLLLPCALSFLAYWLDFASIAFGWWAQGLVSKIAFCVLLIVALVLVLKIMPENIRATMREKELIAERNRLQVELQNSHISLMLSQIQPHFLYNTLNTIHYLCGKDAEVAQSAISSFSDYLRNNLDSIDCNELVLFDKELQHIKTYLELEKIRFGEELEIIYDIQTTSFLLPILTVQPLVENAVKHGTSKKRGGGSVTISTKECDNYFEIKVCDTGVGFDVAHYADDVKKHVGIVNVRERLLIMCNATLEITSEVGKGTEATVLIPKKEESN
ncbi:MAG: sensor histidine kinase [Candidatus Coproplasma sp.]